MYLSTLYDVSPSLRETEQTRILQIQSLETVKFLFEKFEIKREYL